MKEKLIKYYNIISVLAVIVTVLSLISGIIVAVVLESFWTFIYFLVPSILYYIFVSSYATMLGATAENSEMIEQIASSVQKQLEEAKKAAQSHAESAPVQAQDAGKTAAADTIVCPKCGTSQRNNRALCFSCGAKLDK